MKMKGANYDTSYDGEICSSTALAKKLSEKRVQLPDLNILNIKGSF